ncbi:MAG: polysaccharide deacetylase family protein [Lachnospiraceae bacterium]|nr:polysaccharide deacetylase family protein [Lachnospiraceae bacterium]
MGRKEQRQVHKSVHVGRIGIVRALILAATALILYVPLFAGYKAKAAAANGMVDSKKIAITFDDGPHPYYTEQLLDGLKEREVKATFFVTGKHVEQYPELIERMYEEGHLIGNHTYSHLQLNRNNGESFKEELIKTNELIEEVTGQEVQYVRPPYGSWDKKFEKELNMFPVLWNIDPLDWCSDNVACIVQKVTSKAKENSIILMHDEYKSTVTAALQIIDALQKEGYEFVTVDEILFD